MSNFGKVMGDKKESLLNLPFNSSRIFFKNDHKGQ